MYISERRSISLDQMDWWLVGTMLLLAVFGIAMIYSATRGVVDPIIQSRWSAQIGFLLIGLVAFCAGALLDYRLLQTLGLPGYIMFVGMLLLVELAGVTQNEATRWIQVGGTTVQPTEAGKFLLIVIVAWYLSRFYTERKRLSVLVLGLALMIGPLFLVYRQPDLGMTVTMLFIIGAMVLMSGITWFHTLILGGTGLAFLTLAYHYLLAEYMKTRIDMFRHPGAIEHRNVVFNVVQAEISVGNGGWFGKGWLEGTQSQLFFLRVRHTDFIFSIVAEEFGFIGSAALLFLLGFMLWRLARTMDVAENEFGRLFVGGVGALLLFQIFINIGMNLQLVPVTGMTLPLISSGGSSLVSTMFALGLTQSIHLRRTAVSALAQ